MKCSQSFSCTLSDTISSHPVVPQEINCPKIKEMLSWSFHSFNFNTPSHTVNWNCSILPRTLKDKFTLKNKKICHDLLSYTLVESRVQFRGSQNISGASKCQSIVWNNWFRWGLVLKQGNKKKPKKKKTAHPVNSSSLEVLTFQIDLKICYLNPFLS